MARLGRRQSFKPKLPALLVGGSPGVYTLTATTGTYTHSGTSAGLIASRYLLSSLGTYTVAGNNASLVYNRSLSCNFGTYTTTGNDAALTFIRKIVADLGTYAVTGNAANLARAIAFIADRGTYTLTGNSASTVTTRILSLVQGSYSYTGNAANFQRAVAFSAATGVYTLTGNNAGLVCNRNLTAALGTYNYTGSIAGVVTVRKIISNNGVYTVTGNTSNIIYNRKILADRGIYALTGNNANLLFNRILSLNTGAYAYTGNSIDFQRAIAFIVATGSYNLSGNAANTIVNRYLNVVAGSYNIVGNNANIFRQISLVLNTGNYILLGNIAGLVYDRNIVANSGGYTLNSGVDFYKILTLLANSGEYLLTGNNAFYRYARVIISDSGIYILTGNNAGIYKSVFNIDVPSVTVPGQIIPPIIIYDASYDDRTYGCYNACQYVFDRIVVWPKITTGNTRVEWKLKPAFNDLGPYIFQLQVGRTGLTGADDWIDVGAPVTDIYFKEDSTKRVYGKFQWTHYRVKLYTATGIYYSDPEPALGVLNFHDWNVVKDMIRMEKLRLIQGRAGREGALLKRKIFGTPCSCVDRQTKETTKPNHTECYGTGIVGGYYSPLRCVYVETSPTGTFNNLDNSGSLGTIDNATVTTGRMINIPQVMSGDIWISKSNNTRWLIHATRNIAEFKGVPVTISAEMQLLPLNHVAYKIPCDFIYSSLIC